MLLPLGRAFVFGLRTKNV